MKPIILLTHTEVDNTKLLDTASKYFGAHSSFNSFTQDWKSVLEGAPAPNYIQLDLTSKKDYRDKINQLYIKQDKPTLATLGQISNLHITVQEGMLRLLEEPPQNLQLVILAKTSQELLETISSRCQVISLPLQLVFQILPQGLIEKVSKKLPSYQDFAKDMISGYDDAKYKDAFTGPKLKKVERNELDFWLWQMQTYLGKIMESGSHTLPAAKALSKVIESRQLNNQNLQKRLVLTNLVL